MIERTLSASAFIVNESRARAEALSLDSYAKLWVDDDVRKLWCLFRDEVYAQDPQALAARNRFFLECADSFFTGNPHGIFINIAAGFTSYPYLMENPVETIEIDLPAVVEYKKKKTREFRTAGYLPDRDVTYLACDLNTGKGIEAIVPTLSEKTKERPSFILLEGISYYLKRDSFFSLLNAVSRLQTPGSELSLDYWEPEVLKNRIFMKFRDFLEKRCGHPGRGYNLLTPTDIRSISGYSVGLETDVSAVERRISEKPVLQEWTKRLPENFVKLVRT